MAATNEKSAFLREMKKKQKELASSAQKEATTSFLDDGQIIELLGLGADVKRQVRTKVSRVGYGLDKNKNLYYSFNFVIIEGEHKGTTISKFIGLGGDTKEQRERRGDDLYRTFQRLDVDTTKWSTAKIAELSVDAADALTAEKPGALLSLSTWGDKHDRLNINVVSIFETDSKDAPSSPEDSEESDTDTDFTAMGKEADDAGNTSHTVMESEANKRGIDPDEYSDWESLGVVLDGGFVPEVGDADIDFNEYVLCDAKYNSGDGEVSVSVTAYDADSNMFSLEDTNGEAYEAQWGELDFGNGFGEEA